MFWQGFGSSEGELVYLKFSLFFPAIYLDLIKTLLHPKNPYPSAEPSYTPADQHSLLHNLVSSTDWLRLHLISSFRSLIRTLNRTGPNNEPWGTPLVTSWTFLHLPSLPGPNHQPILNPGRSPPIQTTGCQLLQKNVVKDVSKGLLRSR